MRHKHPLLGVGCLLILATFLLVACTPTTPPVPSPVVSPTPTVPLATVTPLPVTTPLPTAKPTVAAAIIVGLLRDREPDTLWPLGSPTEEQRMVQAAVMEPPITTLGYDYQPVLFTEVPTLENGGAVLTRTTVFLDPATGAVTTTDTGLQTETVQMRVTFRLRSDLFWSDGRPVKASDSKFGYNVACSPGSGYPDVDRCDRVQRYEALDDRTIQVIFRPDILEMDYFTYYWPFLPEHAWSHFTVQEMSTAEQVARRFSPCYGPYMVEEWLPGERITLVRNPFYVLHGQGYPAVDKIIFKFLPDRYSLLSQLLAGQIDLVERHGLEGMDPQLLAALEENGLLRLYSHTSPLWENIVFNLNDPADLTRPHPVLSDLRVRQAIAYATNRQGMANTLFMGRVPVLNSWIPSEHWAYPGDSALTLYSFDQKKAVALLEEAGWVLADDGYRYKDGARLKLRLHILAGQPLREAIAQQLQESLGPVGMEIEVVRVREDDWYGENSPLTRRAFELVEFAWVGGMEPDGQAIYTCGEIPRPENGWHGQNYGGWCNTIATAALLSAAKEVQRDRRQEYYRLAQEQFAAELPALPLFHRLDLYAANPGLNNLKLDPTEVATWNCWEWSLLARK